MNFKYDIQEGYLILTVEMGYADSSSVMIPLKSLAEGLDKHITHPKPKPAVKKPRVTAIKKGKSDEA